MSDSPLSGGTEARAQIPAIIAFMLGGAAVIVSIISLILAATDRPFLGVGFLAAAVAGISFLFAGYGLRLARTPSRARPRFGPLKLLVALAFFLGVLGSIAMFLFSSDVGSRDAAIAALVLLVLSSAATITGSRLMGLAIVRSRESEAG